MSISNPNAATVSLKRNITYAMIARLFMVFSQFAVLAIVVHMGTQEDVGALTLASAIVTPLFFLTSMGMKEVHVVDDLHNYTREDYVALRIVSGMVAVVLTVFIVLVFQDDETRVVQLAAIAFAFVRFFGAQANLNQGIFQRAERLDYAAVSTIVRGVVGLIAFAVTFWSTRSLPAAFMMEAIVWFFSYFAIDRALLIRMHAQTQLEQLRQVRMRKVLALAWWVLPMGVSLWMIRMSNSAPPLVLARYADLAAVGLFGTLAYVHSAISMAMGPMGAATMPRLRRYYASGQREAFVILSSQLLLTAALLGLAGVAFSWFAGDFVLKVMFGEAYRNVELLTIIVTGTGFSIVGMQVMVTLTAAQAFQQRLVCSAVGLAAAAISSITLIPIYGIYGAGWAMVAMAVARLLFSLMAMRKIVRQMPAPATTDIDEVE